MLSDYLEINRLANYLDAVRNDATSREMMVFTAYMRAAFIFFRQNFDFPEVHDTKFCFGQVYVDEKAVPALYIENNHAVVYKQLVDKDFDRALHSGAMYDRLIRYENFGPILHCDIRNEYRELEDDYSYNYGIIGKALTKAKSARFEHGDCG